MMPGMIILWSGAVVDIPAGWLLCDGNNGTPDLRNKFITKTKDTYNPKDTRTRDTYNPKDKSDTSSHVHSYHPKPFWRIIKL